MPHLTISEKAKVIVLLEEGLSERRVADRLQIPKSTVHNVKTKWMETNSLERAVGSGRPRVSTQQQNDNVIAFLQNHPFESAVTAHAQTAFPGSLITARRRIRDGSNLRNRATAQKPFLTQANKEGRCGFALQYLVEEDNFWENVIFTDEKVFQSCYNGRIRV